MTQTTLRSIGVVLIVLGAIAFLAGMDIIQVRWRLVTWMEAWGQDTAWVIRIATGLVGAALLFLTPRGDD
ncbi:MAG: hypothetical protein ACI9KE_000623 [Polyangiales bacterium]